MNKKILVGSIIAVVILIIASFPTVGSNEGKPDLIIEDIVFEPDIFLYREDVFLRVRNIGDTKNIETIEFVVVVFRMLFGLIPIYVETSKTWCGTVIEPGKAKDLLFENTEYLPTLGFFKLYCTVNPDQTIDEEYYFNNHYTETFLVIFKSWVEL